MSDGDDGRQWSVSSNRRRSSRRHHPLEIVIVIIDYLILLVATLPQLFLSNPKYYLDHG